MADYLNIAGRVRTTASDGVAMEAQEVKDLNLNKSQQEINTDVQTELGDRYTKEETYSKEQVNELITTPDADYVNVVATNATTAVTDILPATGEANTIYRVGNWNSTQYDPTMYALFAWNGSAYVCLAVRSFVGEVYDVSVNHPDGQGNPTPYANLAAALGTDGANIPADIRRGGMRIQFIEGNAQNSDNKYVQARLMADSWSIDTNDWSIADEGVYVENPEFIEVKLDGARHILWAIKADGSIYYGAGVPQQVIDYIEEKIAELSLNEYEDIVAFLNGLEEGDKTLQTLLNEKVDKEEGKSLVDAEYADGVHYIENPEFIEVKLDSQKRILEATYKDGKKLLPAGVEINGNINYEGYITSIIDNPEFIEVKLDSKNRIIWAIKTDGTIYYGAGIPKQIVDYVTVQIGNLDKTIEDIEDIKQKINTQFAFSECTTIRKLIPSYYFDYDALPESINEDEYLDGVIASVPDNCKKVIFFTDSHWGGYNWTGNQGRDYEGISTPIMLYCKNRLYISNVIFGGDILMQNMPQTTALLWGRRFMNNVLSAFGRSMLFVKGNHDFNQIQGENPQYDYTSLLNYTLTYPIYTKYLNGSVVFDEELISTAKDVGYTGDNLTEISCFARQHYYKDDHDAKVRYIIIDTGSNNRNSYLYDLVGGDSFAVLWLQYAFIYSALMSTPDGYDVVVAGHFFLNYNYGFVVTFAGVLTLCKMLSAFKVKGAVSISYPSGISNLAYAGSNFNFKARKDIGKIFVLCGDSHQDASAICQTNNGVYESVPYYDNVQQSDDAILVINTMCEVCGGVMSHTGGNATSHRPMTQGTITETAFDIVAWDSEHIYCKRVGDGIDRTFNY